MESGLLFMIITVCLITSVHQIVDDIEKQIIRCKIRATIS